MVTIKEKLLSPQLGKIFSTVYIVLAIWLVYLNLPSLNPQLSDKQIELQYGVDAHFNQPEMITEKLIDFISVKLFYQEDGHLNPINPPDVALVQLYEFKTDESCQCLDLEEEDEFSTECIMERYNIKC